LKEPKLTTFFGCLPCADWLWRDTNGGTSGIGPRGVIGNEYPNTNAYQHGIVVQTNWMITNIKPTADGTYSFDLVKAPPTDSCANVDCNQGTPRVDDTPVFDTAEPHSPNILIAVFEHPKQYNMTHVLNPFKLEGHKIKLNQAGHYPAASKGGICRNFNVAPYCDCNWGWVCVT
jgi:hypothetical protein